jgi:uncharacterized membrane protein
MPRRTLLLIASVGCLLLVALGASAQNAQSNLTVTYPAAFAVSTPLSHISPSASSALPALSNRQTLIPLRTRPLTGRAPLAPGQMLQDQALQTGTGAPLELENDDEDRTPRFPGVGANGFAPPDPNIAVGPNHIVQLVNVEIGVYNKSGTIFPGYPKTVNSLFSGLGGGCSTQNGGDVIVQYDKAADRWLVSQLGSTTGPYSECIAVSRTNDPTGAYNLYSYSFGSTLNDYPKFGVWPTGTNSAYLATYNLFAGGSSFLGADVCAYDRAAMLSGAASPAQICFTITNDASYLPSDLDGSTLPPAGSPGIFLTFETLSSLRYYQLSPDFASPANSTLSTPTDITVASFSEACGGGTCIPQPGTSTLLDSLGDRPMYRLAYRNFGDHEALVFNHSVAAGSSTGVRWYELRSPLTEAFTLYQQGTFAPDSTYRWMGSAAMDSAGDIAVGYSASSSSIFPAIRYTGRTPTDPLGSLRAEASLLEGSGSQTGGLTRWGDYSALRIDPSDDCTFWYVNQYQPSNGSFNWATFIGSFKFTNCGTAADFSISASPASQTVVQGNPTSYTVTVTPSGSFTSDVTLSVSGLPSGANATFGTNPVSGGSGSSTMNVTTSTSTPAGTYTLTITGTSGSLTHTTSVSLTVNPAAAPNFSLSASPGSVTVVQGSQAATTITITPSNGFSSAVTLSASGQPSGVTASFSPNPATGTSTLTFTAGSTASTGTFNVTVTGTSGSLMHTTSVSLTVNTSAAPNFSLSASPGSVTVGQGSHAATTITITPSNGFNSSVTLSASGLPGGVTASFSPDPATGTSTLTFTAGSTASTGTFNVTVTGTSGSLTHTTSVSLTVTAAPNFSLSASPRNLTIARGTHGTSTITITPSNGFNSSVTLSASNLPSGVTASFSPDPATSTSTLTLTVGSTATPGPYTVRVRGTSGSLSHRISISLTVQ